MGAAASALSNADNSIDTNQEKVMVMCKEKFEELDVDKNGFLENTELIKVIEWVLSAFAEGISSVKDAETRMMERIDSNKDGKLDYEEFSKLFILMLARFAVFERAKVKFTELDADSSGFLEGAEIDKVVDWALEIHQGEKPGDFSTLSS